MSQSINYKDVIYSFCCCRKHLLKDSKYYVYILPRQLIITSVNTEQESNHPKYCLPISLQQRIHWKIAEKTKELSEFGFLYKNQIKFFSAKENEILKLKDLLRKRIMFREIADFYVATSLLGKGASSKVYLVKEKDKEKKQFASKCIEKTYLMQDGGYQSLFLEIQNMLKINHPNIIHLHEVFEGESTFYMILEYLEGKSLADFISKSYSDGISLDKTNFISNLFYFQQLLEGIEYIHVHNIMHRDLKPENIMFKDKDNLDSLKIVDFGLATSTFVDEYPFPKCGTPGYVAPEIARLQDDKEKYDKVSDIFSAGCIFYKLITMKELFPGSDYREILRLNKQCNINLSNLAIYKTPLAAQDLMHKMLLQDPLQRITAKQALEHSFFISEVKSPSYKKSRFQQQKEQKDSKKPYMTENFMHQHQLQNLQKLNALPQFKDTHNYQEVRKVGSIGQPDDCDIEEEDQFQVPKVPFMKKKHFEMGSFIMITDLRRNHQNPKKEKGLQKKTLKKFQTTDFQEMPDQNSSNHVNTNNHPTLVINNSQKIINSNIIELKNDEIYNCNSTTDMETPIALSNAIFNSQIVSPSAKLQKYNDQKIFDQSSNLSIMYEKYEELIKLDSVISCDCENADALQK